MQNEKQNELILPEWVYKEPNESRKIYDPKPLKGLARNNIKFEDEQLNKELAKKMLNPFYFTDRTLQVGFNMGLESHHINHANTKIIVKPNFPEFRIKVLYTNEIVKNLSVI